MTLEEQKQKLDVSLFHLRKSYQTLKHLKNRLTEAGFLDLAADVQSADKILDNVYKQVSERYIEVDRQIREVSYRPVSSNTRSA